MRSIKIFGFAALFGAAALASTAFINVKLLNKVNLESKGFAVVELFTSEGCSSCPPADELVAKIEKESKDKPVYILAFHVDYWNRLGWKDQFSSADFSKRQHDYARYLNLQGVYTPQIVVNGKTEFVGSQEGTLRNAIRTGLQKAATARVDLNVSAIDQKQASLKYTVEGIDKNTVLQVAILEKAATSKVAAGENSGRTLSHVQIVRKLQQVVLSTNNGTAGIILPHGFDAKKWEIVGFLQNKITGAVTGAGRAAFSNEAMASAAQGNRF
ncbi:thioredoxin family protein [Mucilaginibacter sp.]|uniref:DUF1223 domain-containing protein n=1 Tax=Mucilaginibacter sp. TaxID=1882438 RepID=UPI00263340EE|nr:DUF1223 domain-containing protein [Mucilaginibacter sp.]MDB4921925.1 hypothetical protein [Mucilaginibacter sp.]